MAEADEGAPSFPGAFDDEFTVGSEDGNRAFFGRDVLGGLIEGIGEFIDLRQPRWRQFRSLGPALLGSAMWIDDPELIDKLGELSGASIVVTKQDRGPWKRRQLEQLEEVNERTPGLPACAFPLLGGLAPKIGGEAPVIGPYDSMDGEVVPTIRTLGFRRQKTFVPLMHAKLALLGHLWWHDEGPSGHVEDVVGFTPQRLWVSSANFTTRSRSSLEFGYWTEEGALLKGAERFLVNALRYSEVPDPDADTLDPTLAPVEFDDAAMAEALGDSWDESEDEDPV